MAQPATDTTITITVGVLALQGAFVEHIRLLQSAAGSLAFLLNTDAKFGRENPGIVTARSTFAFLEVRTSVDLARCDALVIPGGESTSISLIAERTGLLDPLREFVKARRKPVWGTCAGLILLAESANKTKATGQALIGGLDVRVHRNYFGRQVESFEADLDLPFLDNGTGTTPSRFHSVFIRAPVVEEILDPATTAVRVDFSNDTHVKAPALKPTSAPVEVLARLPGRARALPDRCATADDLGETGDIVAVRQGNVFGTAFHPELTGDDRIHAWWLHEVLTAVQLQRRGRAHGTEVV